MGRFFNRLGLYWSYATRSLTRGGQRTLLAIFCVAVGVMAIVSLQLVGNMVNQGLTGNVREGNGGDIAVRFDVVPLRADQVSVFDQLKTQGMISNYTAVSSHSGQVPESTATVFFSLLAVDPNNFPLAGAPIFVDPGNGSLSSLLTGNHLVLTANLAKSLKVKVGDALTISSDDGRVVNGTVAGIVSSSGFFQRSQAFIALNSYKTIPSSSGLPATYSSVYVNVPGHTDANAANAKKAIQKDLPSATAVTTTKEALQQNQNSVQNIRYFLQVVGLLALLIGGIGIINTMQVLLRRRQTEIAMLKTSGYQRGDLYALFGTEAALLGLAGGIVGSAAGVGVSFIVKGLVENAFQITLPIVLDPLTIASGVAIGFATALIFGLLPIVQAAQIRPLAVLRDLSEGLQATSVLLSLLLSVLLALLFFGLAYLILGNFWVALGAVGGAAVFLALLSLFFALVVLILSHFPIPERITWWYALIVLALLGIGGLLLLVVPAFGILILVVGVLALIPIFLSRTPKANTRMALRNIGRQRARTVTTLVALFIGVFAIGLILTLGLDIRDEINNAFTTQITYNSFILATSAQDQAAVTTQVNKITDAQAKGVNVITNVAPVAVRGEPIGEVLQGAAGGGASNTGRAGALFSISGVTGYNLAAGQNPADDQVTLAQGIHDPNQGRLLTKADANTLNVLLPQFSSLAPLNLRVGDTITIANAYFATGTGGKGTGQGTGAGTSGKAGSAGQPQYQPITLKVVGFYSGGFTVVAPILADQSVAQEVGGPTVQYLTKLRLAPSKADQELQTVQTKVKSARTFSFVQLTVFIDTLLSNLIILLTAVASLAMIAGFIIIANAVGLAMLERRRELGILKSVGYTSGDVLGEVVLENGLIGFSGAFLAMILVAGAAVFLSKVVFQGALAVSPWLVVGVVLVTALVCLGVAGLVAYSATRVRPLEVLRYE